MSDFNENTRVQVPAALHLCKLGYTYFDDNDIMVYDHKTNILPDVFLRSVKHINPDASGEEVSNLFAKIVNVSNNEDLGREFYAMLSANSGIKLIDFENPENNEWHVTTEFTCHNDEIKEKGYSMSAGQYFDIKIDYVDITEEKFNRRMAEYQQTLTKQFEENHRLEKEILAQQSSLKFNENVGKDE